LQGDDRTGESISIYEADYPTKDGTCIRDYVHVGDSAAAHVLALENLAEHSEIIEVTRRITGRDIRVVEGSRGLGEAAILVASAEKTKRMES
jgi:UDP-glucose 4-epimerase